MEIERFGIYQARELSFGDFLCGQWEVACDVLSRPEHRAADVTEKLREMLKSWFDLSIGEKPPAPSYVAGDGFPAEMSVNWSGPQPEVRVLFDVGFASARPNVDALALTHRLPEQDPLVSLSRFAQVEDIFLGGRKRQPDAPLWHSIAWRPGAPPVFKAYFGLYRWNDARRGAAVKTAMERLGMGRAWTDTQRRMRRIGGRRELEFFALDLSEAAHARAKVYYRNRDAGLPTLDELASVARTHDSERALAAYRTLVGPDRADAGDAPLTCLAFRGGVDQADESNTYLRMADLAPNERETTERVAALLRRDGIPDSTYRALVDALAPARLDSFRGLQELVTYRSAHARGDLTTYFRFSVYPTAA